jgi:acyl carrier protein
MTNLEKYNTMFLETFDVSWESLPTLQYKVSPEWDSIAFVNLIALTETTFGIVLEADDALGFTSYEKGKAILLKYHINM